MPNVQPPGRVLIAGVSARAMADSAARSGYQVTALDAFGDLDRAPGVRALSLSRDYGERFTAASAARVAASIESDVAVYLSPFENHASSVSRLANGRALWGNSAAVLKRVRDPALVAEIFPAQSVSNADRWLLKPRRSGGGHGIDWWRPGDPIPTEAYTQRFVEGVSGSIVFVAAGGRSRPLGLTRQIIGDPAFGATGFRYCGNILAGAADSQFERDAELVATACQLTEIATREFALVGVNGIDFVARDAVPVVTEVNPRYSASMELVERAHGVSIFAAHARACSAGALPEFDLAAARLGARAFGKAIIFARHDVTCGDTSSWLDDPTVRDVPHPGEHIPAGRPVCTVFADAIDSTACYAALEQRAATVYATLERWSSVPA